MIDKYIGYIADVRRYSQRTQQIYRDVLEQFASYAQITDFSEVTPTLVRAYELHILDEKKLGPRTVNLHLSVLSGFFISFLLRYCLYLLFNFCFRSPSLSLRVVSRTARDTDKRRLPLESWSFGELEILTYSPKLLNSQ